VFFTKLGRKGESAATSFSAEGDSLSSWSSGEKDLQVESSTASRLAKGIDRDRRAKRSGIKEVKAGHQNREGRVDLAGEGGGNRRGPSLV